MKYSYCSGRYPWDKDSARWLANVRKIEATVNLSEEEMAELLGMSVEDFHNFKAIALREKKQAEEFKFKPGDIVIPKPGYRWRIPRNNILRVHSLVPSAETPYKDKGYVLEKADPDALRPTLETYHEPCLETFHDLVLRVATVANVCTDVNLSCADCPYTKMGLPCEKIAAEDRSIIEEYLMLIESGVIKEV